MYLLSVLKNKACLIDSVYVSRALLAHLIELNALWFSNYAAIKRSGEHENDEQESNRHTAS